MPFTIGLIDEEVEQLRAIRRTIKVNTPNEEKEPNFMEYELLGNVDTLSYEVSTSVIEDILKNNIDGLIVDYKIMIQTAKIEGSDIYKAIRDVAPEFPVVILTDVPGDCYEKGFVDADKVYKKSDFFKLEETYSQDKVFNLFQNMKRYKNTRNGLELEYSALQHELKETGSNSKLIDKLVRTEAKLSEYKPLELTQIEKAYDASKIEETFNILREVESMLGE